MQHRWRVDVHPARCCTKTRETRSYSRRPCPCREMTMTMISAFWCCGCSYWRSRGRGSGNHVHASSCTQPTLTPTSLSPTLPDKSSSPSLSSFTSPPNIGLFFFYMSSCVNRIVARQGSRRSKEPQPREAKKQTKLPPKTNKELDTLVRTRPPLSLTRRQRLISSMAWCVSLADRLWEALSISFAPCGASGASCRYGSLRGQSRKRPFLAAAHHHRPAEASKRRRYGPGTPRVFSFLVRLRCRTSS